MITLSVRDDFAEMRSLLTDFERRQMPFAAARALTFTAKRGEADLVQNMGSAFDRPTPFTSRAIGVISATKASQQAVIFVRPIQAQYLSLPETGGTRRPKKRALVNPAGVRLNQYGNIPNRALARLKRRRDVFVGTVRGAGGVWQRKGRALTLLMSFSGAKQVKRHPWFVPRVTATVRAVFPGQMQAALAEALRTARR